MASIERACVIVRQTTLLVVQPTPFPSLAIERYDCLRVENIFSLSD